MKRKHRKDAPVPADPVVPAWISEVADGLTDEDLHWIAQADYGNDSDAHFTALAELRADPSVFRELPWHPHEALALTRWHDVGARSRWDGAQPGQPDRERQHRCRLFCCVVLLIAACREAAAPYVLSSNENLAIALESLIDAFPEWLDGFGGWCDVLAERMVSPGEEIGYLPLAALIAEAAREAPRSERLQACIQAIEARLATIDAEGLRMVPITRRYGRLIDVGCHDQRHDLWQAHLDRTAARLQLFPACGSVVDWLRHQTA